MTIQSIVVRGRGFGGVSSYVTHGFVASGSTPPTPTVTVDTHDLPYDEWKKYRKKHEHAAKLAEGHHAKKYIKQAVKVAEIIEDTKIDSLIIKAVAEKSVLGVEQKIDFSELQSEII